jgi:hypothetical protein
MRPVFAKPTDQKERQGSREAGLQERRPGRLPVPSTRVEILLGIALGEAAGKQEHRQHQHGD